MIDNQHLACQVRSSLKTVILSEVETKGLKRQLRKKSDDLVETEEEAVDEVEDIVNGSMEAALTKKLLKQKTEIAGTGWKVIVIQRRYQNN